MKKNGRIKNFHEKDLDKPSASIVINGELFKLYFDQNVKNKWKVQWNS